MTRVALVATTTATEDPEVIVTRFRGLLDAGWDAHLLLKGERWRECSARVDEALASRVEFAPELPVYRRLSALRPALIHYHSGAAAGKGMAVRKLASAKTVVSFREDGADLDGRERWERAALLLFGDAALRERAVLRGLPDERAEVLDPPLLDPAPVPERESVDQPLRLLSRGALLWEQGFEHSVHAVRLLADRGLSCHYRLIGAGEDVVAIAYARHQLGIERQVEIVPPGEARSLADELRSAHVFVEPAVTSTGSTNGLDTAQALGVPCVATPRPGLAEGSFEPVRRRDPQGIAAALHRLATEPGEHARAARAARAGGGRPPTPAEDLGRLEHHYRQALGAS